MNKIKSIILRHVALMILLFLSIRSFAQTDSTRTKSMTDRMKTALTLSDEQYSKVYRVNQDFLDKLSALKTSGGRKLARLRQMRSLDKDRDSQLKGILTSEQYQEFQKNKADNRQRMKEIYQEKPGHE